MTKNIYQVVDTSSRKVVEVGFSSREEAKVVRNELNKSTKSETTGGAQPRFVVSRGTDHPLGATDGIDHGKRKKWWS